MRKLYNIKLKDQPHAKVYAIKCVKDDFGYGLIEAKEIVEKMLERGEIVCNGEYHNTNRKYEIINSEFYMVEKYFKEVFDFELLVDEYNPWAPKEIKPDAETEVALMWYETQPEYIKQMIDAVGKWKNPMIYAIG